MTGLTNREILILKKIARERIQEERDEAAAEAAMDEEAVLLFGIKKAKVEGRRTDELYRHYHHDMPRTERERIKKRLLAKMKKSGKKVR